MTDNKILQSERLSCYAAVNQLQSPGNTVLSNNRRNVWLHYTSTYQWGVEVSETLLKADADACERWVGVGGTLYLFDAFDGVVSRHGEFEEDPSRQQEVHVDRLVPLLLPLLLHPILPWGHGDGLSFTASSSAAHQNTSRLSTHRASTAGVNMSTIIKCPCMSCLLFVPKTLDNASLRGCSWKRKRTCRL